jgi:uncharacterized protein
MLRRLCVNVYEFFSIVTYPKIYSLPSPLVKAIDQIRAWLESPSLALLVESGAHWPTLRALPTPRRVVGPQVHDARIAALRQQHAVAELWSADPDFRRFPKLVSRNPLVGSERATPLQHTRSENRISRALAALALRLIRVLRRGGRGF